MVVYRAYCHDPLCKWVAADAHEDIDLAYDDLNAHMQFSHYSVTEVKAEYPL